MEFKVHIFCGTTNLCRLLSKLCTKDAFSFCCTDIKEKNISNIFNRINYAPDCIIIDKDIDEDLKDEIIIKYYIKKQQLDEAKKYYKEAINLYPHDYMINKLKGEIYK